MKRKARAFLAMCILVAVAYVGSYLAFRASHIEIWERNHRPYVIFPKGEIALYYFWRPLTYVDGALTGMSFHIGPHR